MKLRSPDIMRLWLAAKRSSEAESTTWATIPLSMTSCRRLLECIGFDSRPGIDRRAAQMSFPAVSRR